MKCAARWRFSRRTFDAKFAKSAAPEHEITQSSFRDSLTRGEGGAYHFQVAAF
jgi:hypothetical protein